MRVTLIFAAVILGATLAIARQQGTAKNIKQPAQPAPFHLVVNPPKFAPDFALEDSSGRVVRLSDYRGKVVLVDFWATWCGGCTTEVPWYIQFEKRYGKQGFAAIGISMDAGWKELRPFAAKEGMNYPVVIGSMNLLNRYGDNGAMPATFLVGPDGKIAACKVGIVNREEFEAKIRAMLSQ
jgi:peroxiredoxin